jgi:sirohydrochlorin ferrochelatase
LKRGLLIIDRGSREKEASQELETICQEIKKNRDYAITNYCFLEVEPPFIEAGISKCLKEGIDSLTVIPYFLYPGKKVKNAISDVEKLQKDSKIEFLITKPMSMHKTLVEIVENRISTTLEENKVTLENKDVDVMIIGHGSKDPNAQTSLDYIVNELSDSYRNVSRCWLEIEQPDIFEGVKKCEKDNPKVLVIVFYFLHEGAHVKTDINIDLIPALKNSNLKNTYITKHIGTDQKIINLIIERAKEVEDAD